MKKALFFCLLLLDLGLYGQDKTILQKAVDAYEAIDQYYDANHRENTYHYLSLEQLKDRGSKLQSLHDLLIEVPHGELSRQEQMTRSTLLLKMRDELSYVKFKTYLMPFNAEGGFFNTATYTLSGMEFLTEEDYQNYHEWVVSYLRFIGHNIKLLNLGMKEKIMRPKVIVKNALSLLQPYLSDDLTINPFGSPFVNIPSGLSEDVKSKILEKGKGLLLEQVIPKYRNLQKFFQDTYLPNAPSNIGISAISNGKAYYEDRIRFYTTLEITPDSVYQLGLSEVCRIRKSMEQIIEDLNYNGDFEAFIEFLRTDPQFYAKTPQELLDRAAWLSKKAEGKLPPLFKSLYALPFTVEPVPDAIAQTYTGGRYVPGSRSQNRPGIYWVNTYDLKSRPLYTLPALTLHEAVPGHHLGMMVAAELTSDIPQFRKQYYISAYGEGWGLYAEYLGEEMGMYETPYELFGRYTYEMWRACRLVVDVGIHYKGWSRQEAIDYLAQNTALSMHEVVTEIDRYIGWPGQAVSYKIGELTIKDLREQAALELEDHFSVQDFHQVILSNGSIPLFELHKEVEAFIEKNR